MDRRSIKFMEDIVLKSREMTKSNKEKPRSHLNNKKSKSDDVCCLKIVGPTLNISEEYQKQLLDTLNNINGTDFKFNDMSAYTNNADKGKQHYLEHCQLVVKELVSNYLPANATYLKNEEEAVENDLSGLKLHTYNFHASHYSEALEYTKGHLRKALELLFYKYYGIENLSKRKILSKVEFYNAFKNKIKEKKDLQSYYGNDFKEDVTNRIWIFQIKLDYLIKNDRTNIIKRKYKLDLKDRCKVHLEGNCTAGKDCQSIYENLNAPEDKRNSTFNDSYFSLEISFPEDCNYPCDPPYFYFYKTEGSYSALNCLRIARRLHNEALKLCDNEKPFIPLILQLLKNEHEIRSYLKENNEAFLNSDNLLFFDTSLYNEKYLWDKNKIRKQNVEIKAIRMGKQTKFEYSPVDCEKYRFRIRYKSPEIIKTIRENQVTILYGGIGCGKTTQVPQYILEEWLNNENEISNQKFGIIVTLPHSMNVISVTERIATEQYEVIGNLIGYQVELESMISSYTRLTFCTERILLERLSDDPQLDSMTHIIVDQVHERSAECDFILMWLKKLIGIRKDLKVILISSMPEVAIFSNYFGKAAVLDVAPEYHYTFSSTEMFLEDIMEQTNYVLHESSEYVRENRGDWKKIDEHIRNFDLKNMHLSRLKDSILDEDLTLSQVSSRYFNYSQATQRNIYVMDHDKINYELIEKIVEWLIEDNQTNFNYYKSTSGAILIFLPDIEEIITMKDILEKNAKLANRKKYLIVPLHSNLSIEEQNVLFQKRNCKVLRIILTTDIAEFSVGIDDMYIKIIDSGKIKERRFNTSFDNAENFNISWISRANYFRRKSRASHTYTNYYIHLYSSFRFNHHLKVNLAAPNICTASLEPLLLRFKILQKNKDVDIYQTFGNMLEPPPADHIKSAIKRLQHVGALNSEFMLTPLGHHLAALPVDVRIGKLILFGVIFCCLDSALTIAACLQLQKNPFLNSFNQKQHIKAKRKEYATENSDQLTDLIVYKKWQTFNACSSEVGNIFANENFLCLNTLHVLANTKYYFLQLLNAIGFVSTNAKTRSMGEDLILNSTRCELNINNDNYKLLKGLICAALYPNIASLVNSVSSENDFQISSNMDETKFLTTDNETVYVHPSSVNFSSFHCSSQFLIFRKKMKKGKIFIQDISKTNMLTFVLFCGHGIDIEVNDGNCTLSLADGSIKFAVETVKVAQLLQLIRIELSKILEQKIRNPQLDLASHLDQSKIVNAIVNIITNS